MSAVLRSFPQVHRHKAHSSPSFYRTESTQCKRQGGSRLGALDSDSCLTGCAFLVRATARPSKALRYDTRHHTLAPTSAGADALTGASILLPTICTHWLTTPFCLPQIPARNCDIRSALDSLVARVGGTGNGSQPASHGQWHTYSHDAPAHQSQHASQQPTPKTADRSTSEMSPTLRDGGGKDEEYESIDWFGQRATWTQA